MSLGLGGLTFIVLLVIKLAGIAAISWFWVFFPLLAGVIFWLGIIAFGILLAILAEP